RTSSRRAATAVDGSPEEGPTATAAPAGGVATAGSPRITSWLSRPAVTLPASRVPTPSSVRRHRSPELLIKLPDQLLAERRQIVRLAAGDQRERPVRVDHELLVDPLGTGVAIV